MKLRYGAQFWMQKLCVLLRFLQTSFLAHFCESFINSSSTCLPVYLFKVSIGMSDFVEICSKITALTLYRVCNIMGTLGVVC